MDESKKTASTQKDKNSSAKNEKTILTQKGEELLLPKKKDQNGLGISGKGFEKFFGYIIDNNGHHFILANLYAKGINASDKDKKEIAAQKKIAERVLVHFLHEYEDFILSECKNYNENYNGECAYYTKNNKTKNNKPENNKFYGLVEVFIDIYADKLAKICDENKKLISSYDRDESSKKMWVPLYFKRSTNYSRNTKGFTPNNTLNQFLKTTAEYLTDHTYNKNTIKRLRRCLEAMKYVKTLPNIDADFKEKYLVDKNKYSSIAETLLKRLPYDLMKHQKECYIDLFNLARLFYNINTKDYSYLRKKKLGFIFPDDELYERFICRILRKCDIKEISENNRTTIATATEKSGEKIEIEIEPDYVVWKGFSHAPIVLDAKFKEYNKRPKKDDLNQVTVYAFCYKSNNAVLIYPRLNDDNNDKGIIHTFKPEKAEITNFGNIHIVMLDLLGEDNNKLLHTKYFTDNMKKILGKIN